MEQHLIVYHCYLNLRGKVVAIVSFVELQAIEDAMEENMYLTTTTIIYIKNYNEILQINL